MLTLVGNNLRDAFRVDPEALTLVTDKNHPLYDERVHLPVDENLVRNIMVHGVLQSIVVRKDGKNLEVVMGRQRVKAAREANRRLAKDGRPTLKVPIVVRRGDEGDLIGGAISENELRRPDEILIKAAKAQRALNFGRSIQDLATDFGVNVQTIENWLKLHDLHPSIRSAVAAGEVKYTVAMRLARLPREKQVAKFKKLRKAGATNANALRVIIGGKLERVCPPSRQQLRRVADAFLEQKDFLSTEASSDAYSFAAWVLGRISTDEFLDCLSSKTGTIAEAVKKGMLLE